MKSNLLSSDRFMLLMTISLLLLSVLVAVLNSHRQASTDLLEKIREVRVSKTRAAVALSVLEDSDQLDLVLFDTADSVENLQLAIIEALSTDVINELLHINSSSVQKTDRTVWHNDKSKKALHSLSVAINAYAREADVVLTLLQKLQAAAQWRPIELRSCSFKKSDHINRVAFSCLIDIYYFPSYALGVNE